MRSNYLFLLVIIIVLSCAKRGVPEGGEKDEDPPIFINHGQELEIVGTVTAAINKF